MDADEGDQVRKRRLRGVGARAGALTAPLFRDLSRRSEKVQKFDGGRSISTNLVSRFGENQLC